METGLLHDYFGNFSTRGKIEPIRGEIERNIRKLWGGGNSEKPRFHFQVEGTFGDDI